MDDVAIRTATPADFTRVLALWQSIDRHVGLADRMEHLDALHAHSPDLFLAASPAFRRSGVARRLVEEGERRLREKGAKRIYALVDRRSEPAEPFWAAQSYLANDSIAQFSRNLPEAL